MHTEEQAKKLWCPMVRVSDGEGYAAENRMCQVGKYEHDPQATWCNCIASACIMWRWINPQSVSHLTEAGYKDVKGYCGLAGAAT